MKYIKTYEHTIDEGEYVIVKSIHPELNDFVTNTIGKIIETTDRGIFVYYYCDIPDDIDDVFFRNGRSREFPKTSILIKSKNKKDLEEFLQQKSKFNI